MKSTFSGCEDDAIDARQRFDSEIHHC